jgi:flagellar basal-body rod protein FlgG
MYLETASSGSPTTGDPGTNGLGVIDQGFLEASNVSVTEELVDLITAQRAFEINSRAVQVSDEMLQRLANL